MTQAIERWLDMRYARLVIALLSLLPTIAVLIWTLRPPLQAITAAYMITPVTMSNQPMDEVTWVDFRRGLQKHFSGYGLYIPMEDIIVSDPNLVGQELTQFMQKACGDGTLYVWVPLKMRLPIYGTMIWDWCWVPDVKRV